jgi:sporulation protein YlmC with PRC-barrel domain
VRGLTRTEGDSQETTPLQLGRPVKCSDGPAGRLSDVVIDPRDRRVTHIVVEDQNDTARLVPAELLVQGWAPDSEVVLSCSVTDIASRPAIRSFSYVGLAEFPESDDRGDVGVEDLEPVPNFGAAEFGEFGADLWAGYTVTYDRIPPGSAELRRSSIAVSADEQELGALDGFVLVGTRLTHVVLQGAVAIPIDSVTAIATDHITVVLPTNPADALDPRWLALS